MSDVLQAIGRCQVRRSNEGKCGEAVAYIIGPARRRFKQAVETCFPGCQIKDWYPFGKPVSNLSTQRQRALDRVLASFADPLRQVVRFKEVREYVDCRPSNFRSHIVKDKLFRERCTEAGI